MKQFKVKYKTVLGINNSLILKSPTFDTVYKAFRRIHPFVKISKIKEVKIS